MQSEEYVVLTVLLAFVGAICLVLLAFLKSDRARAAARRARKQAEADHARHGGWFIQRNGDVYRAATDAELVQLCREGRITPYDEVYGGPDRKWIRAAAVPLPDLVFPARLAILAGPRPRMSGWSLFALLGWCASIVTTLGQILDRTIGSTVADVVTGGFSIRPDVRLVLHPAVGTAQTAGESEPVNRAGPPAARHTMRQD